MTLVAKAGLLALMPLPTEANQFVQMHENMSPGKMNGNAEVFNVVLAQKGVPCRGTGRGVFDRASNTSGKTAA